MSFYEKLKISPALLLLESGLGTSLLSHNSSLDSVLADFSEMEESLSTLRSSDAPE